MSVWINCFEDGTALLEGHPQGDVSVPVVLGEDDLAVLEAIVAFDLLEVSRALGQLYLAGARQGNMAGGLVDRAASREEEATRTRTR